jgi:hypothetical protein
MRKILPLAAFALGASALQTIPGASPLIQWQGRTQAFADGSVGFDFQGVQAIVRVTGATYVSMVFNSTFLAAPPPQEGEDGQRQLGQRQLGQRQLGQRQLQDSTFPKFGVYRPFVNGQRTGDNITVFPGVSSFTVASGLDASTTNEVSAFYSTDPVFNTWPDLNCLGCMQRIVSVTTDGTFLSPAAPLARNLLIIGDSITSGNAIYKPLCANASGDDLSASYGAMLCRRFNANCTTVAISSKGLLHNCCDDLPATIPDFATRVFAQDPSSVFDWSSFPPSAVLVNAGTNDCGHDTGPAWEAEFTDKYVAFMRNITLWVNNPNLKFFVGVGPITERYGPWVEAAQAQALQQYGIWSSYLNFPGCELDGCGHPGPVGHQQMYDLAYPVIVEAMGWQ